MTPQKDFTYYFTKSFQITISLKSEKNVLYAKYCIIIISAREGPPAGERVKDEIIYQYTSYTSVSTESEKEGQSLN